MPYKPLPNNVTTVPHSVVKVMTFRKYNAEQQMIKARFTVFSTDTVTGE